MMRQPLLVSITAVLFAAAAAFPIGAQSRGARKPVGNAPTLSAVQALPLTCAQAWVAANRSSPEILAIVTTLAKVSLANRDLMFPNRRDAGFDAGRGIADDCKADPDALLFAIVDKHVRRVAGTTSR
jgi:hypothetical protein